MANYDEQGRAPGRKSPFAPGTKLDNDLRREWARQDQNPLPQPVGYYGQRTATNMAPMKSNADFAMMGQTPPANAPMTNESDRAFNATRNSLLATARQNTPGQQLAPGAQFNARNFINPMGMVNPQTNPAGAETFEGLHARSIAPLSPDDIAAGHKEADDHPGWSRPSAGNYQNRMLPGGPPDRSQKPQKSRGWPILSNGQPNPDYPQQGVAVPQAPIVPQGPIEAPSPPPLPMEEVGAWHPGPDLGGFESRPSMYGPQRTTPSRLPPAPPAPAPGSVHAGHSVRRRPRWI